MVFWELLLTTIGVSFDVYALNVYEGATYANLKRNKVMHISLLFGCIQTLSLIIGSAIAAIPFFHNESFGVITLDRVINFIIFIFLGFTMYYKALDKRELKEQRRTCTYKYIAIIAAITSIDSLLIGFGMSLLDTRILLEIVIMFVITVVCSMLGLESGYRLGFEHRKASYITGGTILFIIGIELLMKQLNFML